MNATKNIAIAAAVAGLFASSVASQAAEEVALLSMKPLQALSLDRGNEHILSYYLSDNGRCKLYVTHAAEPNWDAPNTFTATRFEAVIDAGSATRYVSSDRNAFEFTCAADALAMNVMALEQVASRNR
jgi:hypothetical protein